MVATFLGKRLQRGKQPLSGRTRPDPQEPKARGWSDGAMERRGREAKAQEAREAVGPNAGIRQGAGPAGAISGGRVRPGRAGQAGGWVPAFLRVSLASSPAPTWAEQRGGVQCVGWGGLALLAPSLQGAAPGLHPLGHLARLRSGDPDLLSGWDIQGTADHAPHPPRHSREAPGSGSPSPSTDWGRNGESEWKWGWREEERRGKRS